MPPRVWAVASLARAMDHASWPLADTIAEDVAWADAWRAALDSAHTDARAADAARERNMAAARAAALGG